MNFLYSIEMSERTLKFNDVKVNKKEFHASKQRIALNLVIINKIVVSDKLRIVIKVLNVLLVTHKRWVDT